MSALPTTIGPGIVIPDSMMQRLVNWQGRETVTAWFAGIEERLTAWCDEWEVDIEQRELPDTVSMVLFGASARVGPVVIKIGPPGFEATAELAATRATAGPGMVRLIAGDPTISLIMLERLLPGTALRDANLDDEEATRIAARKLQAFWRGPSPGLAVTPLPRWTKELREFSPIDHPGFPNALVVQAQIMLEEMLARPRSESLLHGDLHHENILWSERDGWTTIDPKGLVGERGYDITAWMMNPWGFPTTSDFLPRANRRLDILAEALGEDRDRLAQWVVVHAALSLCWSLDVEVPENPDEDVALLESVVRLLPG